MSITYTAFGNNSLSNIYQPPEANSFDGSVMTLKQASSTQLVYETVFQTLTVRTESTGVLR